MLHCSHVSLSRYVEIAFAGRKCSASLLPPIAYVWAPTVMAHALRAMSRYRVVPVDLYSRAAPTHLGTCVLACRPFSWSRFAASGSNTDAWSKRCATVSQRWSLVIR